MVNDLVSVVARLNARRIKGRISVDERAFDELLSLMHERAFNDGWQAGKRFVGVEQGRQWDAAER